MIRATVRRPRLRNLSMAIAAVLGAVLGACGSDGASDQGDDPATADPGFVGEVAGTDAFIAIVVGGGEAVAYVCDGEDDIAEWFAGPVDEADLDLTNEAGARVEAVGSDDGYRGTVTFADGTRREFDTAPAEAGAGLLRITGPEAEADGVVGGWVVANDGEIRGSLRLRGVATAAPAPGETVEVSSTSYPVSIFMTPSKPAPVPPGVPVPYPNVGTAGDRVAGG